MITVGISVDDVKGLGIFRELEIGDSLLMWKGNTRGFLNKSKFLLFSLIRLFSQSVGQMFKLLWNLVLVSRMLFLNAT